MVLKSKLIPSFLLIVVLLTSACQAVSARLIDIPEKDQGPLVTPVPSPVAKKVLSICLGEEPASLFLYGDQSTSARIIRQAIYDMTAAVPGLPVVSNLLEEIPSAENGLVSVVQVEVPAGAHIVDDNGNLTLLANGIRYRPSGCTDPACAEVFGEQETITMDQVRIEFPMTPGVSWADGTPLTSADSIFSYQVASLIYGPGGPKKLRYAASYQIGEEGGLYWTGLPGYLGVYSYADLFFEPLPEHRWKNLTKDELLTSSQSTERPLAWGRYQVMEWARGDHLTLVPNDSYSLTGDDAAPLDALVFRFMESAEAALAAFHSGECQLLANQSGLSEFQTEIIQSESAGDLRIYYSENKAWEQLSFGITSSESNRTLLEDPALRRAVAGCIDRDKIVAMRLDAVQAADDFFPPEQSGNNEQALTYFYQPVESGLALKELGWIDLDGDPATPRVADGVASVADGAILKLSLLAAEVDHTQAAVTLIREGLESCGIGVEVDLLPAADLLAPGPTGPIFGRTYDLAYFAWAAGNYQPCRLFLSSEIPGLYPAYPKGWGGVNAAGYSNEGYDAACVVLLTTLPDSDPYLASLKEVSRIFREELPVLPLFFRREIIIADPAVTGIENSPLPLFWNIEELPW
jgi:peptide/nickel transport system substrate-binding protein